MLQGLNPTLLGLIPKEGLILILGGIGSGKSALAYKIAEVMHFTLNKPVYAFGFPEDKSHTLPDFIQPVQSVEFPEKSIVLSDESYLQFHSRSFMAEQSKFMDVFTGLVRQKAILAVYVSQTARKLDVGIVSSAQLVLIKKPSILQIRLDRSEMRGILNTALEAFQNSKGDHKKHVYAIGEHYEGFIINANDLPSFWSDELSRVWKGVSLESVFTQSGEAKEAKRRSRRKRQEKIISYVEDGEIKFATVDLDNLEIKEIKKRKI